MTSKRLPGELDKAAFAVMLGLFADYKAALKDSGATDHTEAVVVTASFFGGAVSLYAALTGLGKEEVHAAVRAAHESRAGDPEGLR
jgi:hypothetical protein